ASTCPIVRSLALTATWRSDTKPARPARDAGHCRRLWQSVGAARAAAVLAAARAPAAAVSFARFSPPTDQSPLAASDYSRGLLLRAAGRSPACDVFSRRADCNLARRSRT